MNEREPQVASERVPRVSIGMPVWNGADYLREAVDSLLAQSFADFELIISDNASTDATEDICREYVRTDSRVRYHRNDHNIGLHGNFDLVLDLATAPYFMWASHDDIWDPSYLAKMVDQLDRRSSVVLAGSDAASVDGTGIVRAHYDNATTFLPASTHVMARRLMSEPPEGGHSTLIYGLMRTPVIKSLGTVTFGNIRDRNRGEFGTDKLTLFKLLFEGDFHVTDETLYFHRDVVPAKRSGSAMSRAARGRIRLRRAMSHTVDLHRYFGALRTIVLASRLSSREKTSLVLVSGVQESRHVGLYYASRLRGRAGRSAR